MALPTTQQSREYQNFTDVGDGTTARQVTVVGGAGSGLATEATLQSVDAKLADLKTYTDQLEQYVDGLEGLNTSILASTTALEGYLDGVEGLITATNSALSTINSSLSTINSAVDQLEGYTDGVEGLLTTIIGHVDGLETQLTDIQASLTSIDSDIDVALSTRASEATLALIKTRADLLATEATLSAINTKIDVNLSTRASESTLSSALTQLQEINAGTPASLGQQTEANSQPIVIASDQDYPFSAANNTSNPSQAISLGADDTTNIRRLQGRISNPLASDYGLIVRHIPYRPDTFVITANDIVPGNGKSMLSVFNAGGSGVLMRLVGLWIYNVRSTAVSGVVNDFSLRKISAMSAGTAINTTGSASGLIMPMDSTIALNGSITAATGATVTESPAFNIRRWLWSSDEFGSGAADAETTEHTNAQLVAAYRAQENETPFTYRASEGFTVRQSNNTTVGNFNITAIITQELP